MCLFSCYLCVSYRYLTLQSLSSLSISASYWELGTVETLRSYHKQMNYVTKSLKHSFLNMDMKVYRIIFMSEIVVFLRPLGLELLVYVDCNII